MQITASPALLQIKNLPGPRAWPWVGNMLQVTPDRIHQDVEQLCKQYGKFCRVYFGRRLVLVVADQQAIASMLRERPETFRRPTLTSKISLEMGGTPGVFLAEGAEWRNQRRMVMAGFAPGPTKAYFPAIAQVAQRLQRRWQAAALAHSSIDLSADLKRYTVDIIAGLAFGSEVNTLEAGEDTIQRHLDEILPATMRRSLAIFPYWRYFKLPQDRRLDRSVAGMQIEVTKLIAQARQRMQDKPALRDKPGNLLEAMIAAADQPGSGVDDAAVAGNVSTMLLAGEDTTANSIAWLIYLLKRHPEALRQAMQEVRRVAPDSATFSLEQMDALLYLDACINEAMRLKPVAPFMPLEAVHDTVVGDVQVPRGTVVWAVLRHDTVDAAHFADPLAFKPERWLASADSADALDKRASIPFGSGPRTCPGRYLALLEIKTAMAMLLGQFAIEAVDTPDGQEARELMAFVMSPVGLRMRLSSSRGSRVTGQAATVA
jgi:cytochrome P450